MPPLPPPPNGLPLVFEKTTVFDAVSAKAPPLYKNGCEPDPPQHGNRFVWDGRSPPGPPAGEPAKQALDPVAHSGCLKQLPQHSVEAEAADDQHQREQWASPTLGRRCSGRNPSPPPGARRSGAALGASDGMDRYRVGLFKGCVERDRLGCDLLLH